MLIIRGHLKENQEVIINSWSLLFCKWLSIFTILAFSLYNMIKDAVCYIRAEDLFRRTKTPKNKIISLLIVIQWYFNICLFQWSYMVIILQENVLDVLMNSAGLMFILEWDNHVGEIISLFF